MDYFPVALPFIVMVAALLIFAIQPLQRAADRIANAAMPQVQDTEEWRSSKKIEAYKFAVRMALSDRRVTREEERGLATLAAELRLNPVRALDLREEVERELGLAIPSPSARPTR